MGRLLVDLSAIIANYRKVTAEIGEKCIAAAVVKANAYGCGIAPVAEALEGVGARDFFVATLPEALELRTILQSNSSIYMLNGFEASQGALYIEEGITPVLSSMPEVENYAALAANVERALPAIVHIDSGMNRLGIEAPDLKALPEKLEGIDVQYMMSHFACSDEKDHPKNHAQYETFKARAASLGYRPKSLSNSSGIFRSKAYHFDMVRPGMCLYGLNPTPEAPNPMTPVVRIEVPVRQIRTAKKGETCGYGATYTFEKDTRLAIVTMGYADGYLRHLSNKGTLYWKGYACPVRGRVSMDLTIVDLSAIPENELPAPEDMLEVTGEHQTADDIAQACGTIGYEILTALSRRYQRIYKD